MRRIYASTANILFAAHVALGIFFLVGWTIPQIRIPYLLLLISWPISWLVFGYCPLTKLELLVRRRYRPELDTNAEFFQYYAHKFFGLRIKSFPIYAGGLACFFMLFTLSVITS